MSNLPYDDVVMHDQSNDNTQTTVNVAPVQRHETTSIQQVPLRLGVITWNVAHFGQEKILVAYSAHTAYAALQKVDAKAFENWLTGFAEWLDKIATIDSKLLDSLFPRRKKEEDSDGSTAKSGAQRVAEMKKLDAADFATKLATTLAQFAETWKAAIEDGDDERMVRERLFIQRKRQVPALQKTRRMLRQLVVRFDLLAKADEKGVELPKQEFLTTTGTLKVPVVNAFKAVVLLDKTVHKALIVRQIAELFQNNRWLHLIVLQEVNQGIYVLMTELEKLGLQMVTGPHLQSRTSLTSGRIGQHEYYPIVARNPAPFEVIRRWCVFNDGGVLEEVGDGKPVTWSKNEEIYRPIVGYDLYIREPFQPFSIGIVHTTPFGDEFSRPMVYAQVGLPLEILSSSSYPLLVGGDYYLTAEATVVNWDELSTDSQSAVSTYASQYTQVMKSAFNLPRAKLPENVKKIHLLRNPMKITVQKKIEAMGLSLQQPLSGTNLKPLPKTQTQPSNNNNNAPTAKVQLNAQIADFWVATPQWKSWVVGLVNPTGGIVVVDAEDLRFSRDWRLASDHFPVAAFFSTAPDDPAVGQLAVAPQGAAEAAELLEQKRQQWLAQKSKSPNQEITSTATLFAEEYLTPDEGWVDPEIDAESDDEDDETS
ncbi:MAG TPA: hypothetical protein VF266_27615 [Thermoanaerobaculia bacterium]